MLYRIVDGIVSFGADVILDDINFEVKNNKEKIAIIGRNGSGKTTLLKVISGEVPLTKADDNDGRILSSPNLSIGYLKQITFDDLSLTLDDEIRKVFARIIAMKERLDELVALMQSDSDGGLKASEQAGLDQEKLAAEYTNLHEQFIDLGGYFYEKEYDVMLKSFGFCMEDKAKKLSQFSGGQLTKLAFIKLLLSKPDILLLDEPTNHLDISTIAWLEGYLRDYNRAVVIVSHDRMFLDRIVSSVYEITYGKVIHFTGNYTDYVRIKKERYEKQLKDHIAQQKEIKRLTELVEKFKNKPTKVAMTKSKLKMIEHMELIARPADYDTKSFKASYVPRLEPGKDILYVKDLEIGYNRPLSKVSLDLKRGERLGIIGDNGIGKSTLLKTLVGELKALSGEFKYGVNVEVGYFDQQMAQYSSDKTVLDDFWDEFPHLMQTDVRNALGAFLFTQDEVYKEISMLSGGERVRLTLAKIFQRKPNVLILDEPTNHMDLIGKETLEAMLRNFEGTVIFVSHDRYFVKQVATQLLVMTEAGSKLYPFGYESYEEELNAIAAAKEASDKTAGKQTAVNEPAGKAAGIKSDSASKNEVIKEAPATSAQASYQAGKDAARKKKRIEKLEEMIEKLEGEIEELKGKALDPSIQSDYVKLNEIMTLTEEKEEELLSVMEEWEELCEII